MISFEGLPQSDRLDALWAYLMGASKPYAKNPGPGQIRARRRLASKRARNAEIPSHPVITRQMQRHHDRLMAKQERTKAKMLAMKGRRRGGAAIV